MTPEQMLDQLQEQRSRTRGVAAKAVGWPIVLCLEGMGLCIVPEWTVEVLEKLVAKSGQAPGATSGNASKGDE